VPPLATATADALQYPAPRVLLADAHDDTRALYDMWLSQRGFSVIHAASADDLLAQSHLHSPDVVVLELMLPGGGPETVSRLRADPVTADTVVVILTSQNVAALRDETIDAGADIYVVKPCGAARLGEIMVSVSRARFERAAIRPGGRDALLRAAQRTFAIRERTRTVVDRAIGGRAPFDA
jgi:CheY-like chemotaxis protein